MRTTTTRRSWTIAAAAAMALAVSCDKTAPEDIAISGDGQATILFDARYGADDFELNKAYDYQLTNPDGTFSLRYEFTRLRYWVSNVKLVKTDGEEVSIPASYYLIEENNEIPVQDGTYGKVYPANKREEVTISGIPSGDYTGLKFSIGVAPAYNDNLTLRLGELTALNGMANDSWMWFTSYIFTSLSGRITWVTEPQPSPQTIFWETGSNAQYQEKSISFEVPVTIHARSQGRIELNVDVRQIIDLEYPWTNTRIGANSGNLLNQLTANYQRAIHLRAATSVLN